MKITSEQDQPTLFNNAEDYSLKGVNTHLADPNPCVKRFGYGPEDKKCNTCANFVSFQYSNKFFKCYLRRDKKGGRGGPATDHRARWNACGQYKEGHLKEV